MDLRGDRGGISMAAFRPDTVFDWALENTLVFILVPLMIWAYRKLPLSDLSYLLILLYLGIHVFGAHYKYSDVPLGEWMKGILHTQRNHYDRVAHFSFGLLLGAIRFRKCSSAIGPRNRELALLSAGGGDAFFHGTICEMLEAASASVLSPQRLEEFVGMQGDIWDSQEDMLMAGLGSIVAMIFVYQVRKRRAAAAALRRAGIRGAR